MRFEKINIGPIVTGHFGSLEHVQSRRIRWDDVVIHLAVPLVSGIIAFLVKARFVSDSAAVAITALSVFVGLLFNLLVLLSTLRLANRGSLHFQKAVHLSGQILVNLEYAILSAFAAIAVLAPMVVSITIPASLVRLNEMASRLQSALFIALVASFAVTLLMVLRRMHIAMLRNMELTYAAAPEIANRSGRPTVPTTIEKASGVRG